MKHPREAERLLRLLDTMEAGERESPERTWLEEQRCLTQLLRAARPAPSRLPAPEDFYRRLRRRLAVSPPAAPGWRVWRFRSAFGLAAAAACLILAAVIAFHPTGRFGGPPGVAMPRLEALAEIDEIDADTRVVTYQLPDSLTPVVLFSWDTGSEDHATSG